MDTDGADLLARAAAGDRAAFDAFVRRWERPLGAFLLRTTGSRERAEDARQQTFVRVLGSAGSFRGGQVSAWLFRTAYNIAVDLGRAERLRSAAPLAADFDVGDPEPGPDARAEAEDERAQVRRALGALSEEDRALVWLRVADEKPFAAAAAVLGIPESTARLRFVKALGRLKRALGSAALL